VGVRSGTSWLVDNFSVVWWLQVVCLWMFWVCIVLAWYLCSVFSGFCKLLFCCDSLLFGCYMVVLWLVVGVCLVVVWLLPVGWFFGGCWVLLWARFDASLVII